MQFKEYIPFENENVFMLDEKYILLKDSSAGMVFKLKIRLQ